MRIIRTIAALALLATAQPVRAVDVMGTVSFQGQVVFAAPIAGIGADDLTVDVDLTTEATGNGEKCSISSVTSDSPNVGGMYPDAGAVTADVLLERGGPQMPSGDCIVALHASGTDGVSVSARGSQTVFVDPTTIGASGSVAVPDMTIRESKAVAGLDRDCRSWVKRALRLRTKCNFLLLKGGPALADRCKDPGPEPAGCDPGDHVEAILALAHGANDQQTDPPSAEGVDFTALRLQVVCQKRFGRATMAFAGKRARLVAKRCVEAGDDTTECRAARSRDARRPLGQIDRCVTDQLVDGGTGRTVPEAGAPCDACIAAGQVDRKCMKACFETVVAQLTDGIIGDVPECGNGIIQGGEFCDDGNTMGGDCCSAVCTVEAGSPEGPMGNPTCSDALDNDCDGDVDGADTDCQ